MFTVERISVDRLDIVMSGALDVEAMKIALNELIREAEGIENGKMLFDVVDYHVPSFGALVIEFSRLPEMLGLMRRFRKAAVLSDKTWLKMISELEGKLIPGLEIRAFGRAEKGTAERWLGRVG